VSKTASNTSKASAKVTSRSARTAPAAKKTVAKAPATKSATRNSVTKQSTRQPAAAVAVAERPADASAMAVLATEAPWTEAELTDLRSELEGEIAQLHLEIAEAEVDLADLLRDGGDGAGDDQADQGSRTFEREHEMSLTNNQRDMLLQAERAVAKIADGTYGVCESCGNPVGKMRLQAFPRATLCMSCKQRQERR
jgi:DnaK suppressor protein